MTIGKDHCERLSLASRREGIPKGLTRDCTQYPETFKGRDPLAGKRKRDRVAIDRERKRERPQAGERSTRTRVFALLSRVSFVSRRIGDALSSHESAQLGRSNVQGDCPFVVHCRIGGVGASFPFPGFQGCEANLGGDEARAAAVNISRD